VSESAAAWNARDTAAARKASAGDVREITCTRRDPPAGARSRRRPASPWRAAVVSSARAALIEGICRRQVEAVHCVGLKGSLGRG
jgi:hypothetical protein